MILWNLELTGTFWLPGVRYSLTFKLQRASFLFVNEYPPTKIWPKKQNETTEVNREMDFVIHS